MGHRSEILATLIKKSNLKQRVFDNTFTAFNLLKESLHEMNAEFDDELEGKLDKRVRIDYRDRGKYEAQIQIAGEMLIFTMHTNVFDFDASHAVLGEEYAGLVNEDRPDLQMPDRSLSSNMPSSSLLNTRTSSLTTRRRRSSTF